MNVLIVGSGGREHALAWKLAQSPRLNALYAAPGSDALDPLAERVPLNAPDALANFAERQRIDLTVVGPEAPLVGGIADAFAARGLPLFGPTAAAARLEGSKAFAKAFMHRHGIPTAPYASFDDAETALSHARRLHGPCVVKADGLAAGKGVTLCRNRAEAEEAIQEAMVGGTFGEAGRRVVIEAMLQGEEASFFALCDGEDYLLFPSAQDHKRAHDGDKGPNTGGMGAYCPAPLVSSALREQVETRVIRPTLAGMAAEGHPYRGVLYVGVLVQRDTAYVLEYNCRFGDPECQPLLLMLDSDLLDMFQAAVEGRIAGVSPRWRGGAAACVVMAAEGYPGSYAKGARISGLDEVTTGRDLQVFHAGTARKNGEWLTQGGRVLNVTAWGSTLETAIQRAYAAAERIHWPGVQFRRDIGQKGLQRLRSAG